jgi:hypothetical protein
MALLMIGTALVDSDRGFDVPTAFAALRPGALL